MTEKPISVDWFENTVEREWLWAHRNDPRYQDKD